MINSQIPMQLGTEVDELRAENARLKKQLKQAEINFALEHDDVVQLRAELATLSLYKSLAEQYGLSVFEDLAVTQKDAERLDFIEQQTQQSHTGVSFDFAKYTEDGYIKEKGYRVMWFHKQYERKPTLREAIDNAMAEENNHE